MTAQPSATFGRALRQAILDARQTQASLARELLIDAGQVSRWINDKAVPHVATVAKIESFLGTNLSQAFTTSMPVHELYISAPIAGLARRSVGIHHDAVAEVAAVKNHVNSYYWPGEGVRATSDLVASDIAAERNMKVIVHCSAFLYLQFAEIVRPSSALIELGLAFGRRLKTTLILQSGLQQPYILDGFGAVAAGMNFLPKARIYTVESVEAACHLVERNGRELLGLA